MIVFFSYRAFLRFEQAKLSYCGLVLDLANSTIDLATAKKLSLHQKSVTHSVKEIKVSFISMAS